MAIAELEGHSVVTDALHPQDSHAGELSRAIASPALPEDIDFPHVLGARGTFAEELAGQEVFLAVLPGDRYEGTDQLDVPRGSHGRRTDGILPRSQAGTSVGHP
jgi:hypothetical protein